MNLSTFAVFVAQPSLHLAGWVEFGLLVVPMIAALLLLESRDLMPSGATAKRLVFALIAVVGALTLGAAVTHAAIIIDCGDHITWLDWIFWIC